MNVYPFIEAEKASSGNVKRACELLKVSRAAYYAAPQRRPLSPRDASRRRADRRGSSGSTTSRTAPTAHRG